MLVSVIIPVYNVEAYLRECLDTVLAQSYTALEILLIEDGCTDQSGSICDEYAARDTRIRVVHQPNRGVSAARNAGLALAQGEWVLFIDSDDWIAPDLVEHCVAMVQQHPQTDLCIFGFAHSQATSDRPEHDYTLRGADLRALGDKILNRDRNAPVEDRFIKLSSPWKFYRRALLEEHGIRFSEELRNGEDGVLNLYVLRHAREVSVLERPRYYYRDRETSATKAYTPHAAQDFAALQQAYQTYIAADPDPHSYDTLYLERLIWSFSFCCILDYCHPDNPKPYRQRKADFLQEYDRHYRAQVGTMPLSGFGFKKRIVFWCIQKRWFAAVNALCALERRMA